MESHVAEACRLYIAIVLLWSVAGKATTLAGFRDTISELSGLPAAWARTAAIAVVAAEGSIAAALLMNGDPARYGMMAALILFAGFTLVIAMALLQRRAVACNCFGGQSHPISAYDLARNAVMIAAAGANLAYASLDPTTTPEAYAALAGVAIIAVLITTNLGQIARMWR
jgi:hypothetical protein